MATVTIQTGAQSPLVFSPGEQFQWVNTGVSDCMVTKSPTNWDGTSTNPTKVPAGGSVNANAPSAAGNYSWSSPCCQLGSSRVGVGTHPTPPPKK